MIALQERKVLGTRWLLVPEVISPILRAKHLAAALDGGPEPVNTCALMHDGAGRYLLHLRDHKPGAIFESGAFAPSLAAVVRTTTRAWRTRCCESCQRRCLARAGCGELAVGGVPGLLGVGALSGGLLRWRAGDELCRVLGVGRSLRRGELVEEFVGGVVFGDQVLQCLGGEVAVTLWGVEGAGGAEVVEGDRAGQRAGGVQQEGGGAGCAVHVGGVFGFTDAAVLAVAAPDHSRGGGVHAGQAGCSGQRRLRCRRPPHHHRRRPVPALHPGLA